MNVRVKICGITTPDDAEAAVDAGADLIGLNFTAGSPRCLALADAERIAARVEGSVERVAVFRDADPRDIERVLRRVEVERIQLHGDEPPELCAAFGRRWIKAIRMRPGLDLAAEAQIYRGASGLLLDAFDPVLAGGTGRTFDWGRIPARLDLPILLAGGLRPENVAEAIRRVRPFAVDVSGGVESAKGVKDPIKIAAFMRGVSDGDSSRVDP